MTPIITTASHFTLNENRVLNTKMTQIIGHVIRPSQKILDSASEALFFPWPAFRDSYTQWLFPSSSTWFHHRSPTSSLPVMFFTAQKSHDRSRMMVTIQAMKLLDTSSHRRYTSMALTRKNRWKNDAMGCLILFFFGLLVFSSSASKRETSSVSSRLS